MALDIGANIGNHSLYFAKELGFQKIVAFEPVKDTYDILLKNIEINALEGVINPVNKAVGLKTSKGKIRKYNQNNIGGTSIEYSFVDAEGQFDIVAIDEVGISEQIDFIKIDVEGFEVEAVKGAVHIIKRDMPYLYIEISSSDNFCEIQKILTDLHYQYQQLTKEDFLFYGEW